MPQKEWAKTYSEKFERKSIHFKKGTGKTVKKIGYRSVNELVKELLEDPNNYLDIPLEAKTARQGEMPKEQELATILLKKGTSQELARHGVMSIQAYINWLVYRAIKIYEEEGKLPRAHKGFAKDEEKEPARTERVWTRITKSQRDRIENSGRTVADYLYSLVEKDLERPKTSEDEPF